MSEKIKMSGEEFQDFVITSLKTLVTKVDENTQILKALEHKAEVNKAEHDKMSNDIAHMQGDIKSMSNTLETLATDLTHVEIVAAKNNLDIAKLKAVK